MTIKLSDIELKTMPDGMPYIKQVSDNVISACIRDGNDLMRLGLLKEILSRYNPDIELEILYLSAQRMDRITHPSMSCTLKVFADFINSMNFSKVTVHCPHSTETVNLIKNCVVSDLEKKFITSVVHKTVVTTTCYGGNNVGIVIPDKGANIRYEPILLELKSKYRFDIIQCEKVRNSATGKLTQFAISSVVNNKLPEYCLIIDDLGDGFRTHIGIAELLKKNGVKNVSVAVFHAIFSNGWPLSPGGAIDVIWYTNSFPSEYQIRATHTIEELKTVNITRNKNEN